MTIPMLQLRADADQRTVIAHLEPPHVEPVNIEMVRECLAASQWKAFRVDEAALARIVQLALTKPDEVHAVAMAEAVDATLHITVSGDQMSAQVSYLPAIGGKKLDDLAVIQALKAAGVLKGIHSNVMKQLANNPPQALKAILAEGKPPTEAIPGKLEPLATPLQRRQLVPQLRDDGSLNMRDLGGVDTVAEEQPLLRRIPPVPGQNGYNVQGAPVLAQPLPEIALVAGDGTRIHSDDPNLLIAVVSGVPIEISGGMRVDSMLTLNHDIDLSIGNIDYRGSVVIKGDITRGMSVKATGDILIQGSVEPSLIEAGGNVTITEGVLGSQLGEAGDNPASYELQIIAGGILSARHAQHAFLKGAGVQIGSQLFHCLVHANGPVQVGTATARNTILVGGIVQARERIGAGIIGAPSHSRTVLDFSPMFADLMQRSKQLQAQVTEKNALSRTLQSAFERNKLRAGDVQTMQKMKNTVDAVNREIAGLQASLDSTKVEIDVIKKRIGVRVAGRLYPGVEIRVLSDGDTIHTEHNAGTFRFEDGKLVFDR